MGTKINEECLSDNVRNQLKDRRIHRAFVLGPYSFAIHTAKEGSRNAIVCAYHKDRHILNMLCNNIDGAVIKLIAGMNAKGSETYALENSETYAFENYAFLLKAMGIYNGQELDWMFDKKPNYVCGKNLLEFKKLLVDFTMSMHSGYFFMEHISPHCRLYEVLYKMRDHVGLYETPEEALLGFFVHKYGDYIDYNDRLGMETACRRILGLKPNINF